MRTWNGVVGSLVLTVLMSTGAMAEIYKWLDENGRTHYGDSPTQSVAAEPVVLEINSYDSVTYDEIDYYEPKLRPQRSKVTMYSTQWCGYCKKARDYFQENNIAFVEYDIEDNDKARQDYKALGGRGVPLIVVGKKAMSGFTPAGFDRIYP